jgi:hypothetical protein
VQNLPLGPLVAKVHRLKGRKHQGISGAKTPYGKLSACKQGIRHWNRYQNDLAKPASLSPWAQHYVDLEGKNIRLANRDRG